MGNYANWWDEGIEGETATLPEGLIDVNRHWPDVPPLAGIMAPCYMTEAAYRAAVSRWERPPESIQSRAQFQGEQRLWGLLFAASGALMRDALDHENWGPSCFCSASCDGGAAVFSAADVMGRDGPCVVISLWSESL